MVDQVAFGFLMLLLYCWPVPLFFILRAVASAKAAARAKRLIDYADFNCLKFLPGKSSVRYAAVPYVRSTRAGVVVNLTVEDGWVRATCLLGNLNAEGAALTVQPAGSLRRLLPDAGAEEFDRVFKTATPAPERVAAFVGDPRFRGGLLRLRSLCAVTRNVHLSLDHWFLRIYLEDRGADAAVLDQFLEAVEQVLRPVVQGLTSLRGALPRRTPVAALEPAGPEDMRLLPAEPSAAAPALCQICGTALGPPVVLCRQCGTPHHRDCWDYAGCCSIFGCGGTTCLLPGDAGA